MKCKICFEDMLKIFSTEESVAVNRYSVDGNYISKEQTGYFCQSCGYLFNSHDFSVNELFSDYSYSSPATEYLTEAVDIIVKICKERHIKNICEIGGNSGLFLHELKKHLPNLQYTNIDLWHNHSEFPDIQSVETFINSESLDLLAHLKPDLVICRHMFAHNPDIQELLGNIITQLGMPEFIYVENANLEATIRLMDFGQLYSEHFYALTPLTLAKLFSQSGYALHKHREIKIHNGSFAMIFTSNNANENDFEHKLVRGNSLISNFQSWVSDCKKFEEQVLRESRPVYVYAISAKFVFTANAFLTQDFRDCFVSIFDNTKKKEGLYPPGFKSPVRPDTELHDAPNDACFLIGARNFSNEISGKLSAVGISKERQLVPPF